MKTIVRKLIPVIIIVSILLTACGGGPAPIDDIEYTDAKSVQEFKEVGETDHSFEVNVLPDEDTTSFEEPQSSFPEPFPTIDCDQDEGKAKACVGDSNYGFDQYNGMFFCYVDGECYAFSKTATGIEKEAITNTMLENEELGKKMWIDGGEAFFAAATLVFAGIQVAGIAGCTVGAALTLGGSCLLAIAGSGVALAAFIVKFGSLSVDYIKTLINKSYLKNKVKDGILIPCGGNQ
jgi:hypothetical protein